MIYLEDQIRAIHDIELDVLNKLHDSEGKAFDSQEEKEEEIAYLTGLRDGLTRSAEAIKLIV